MRGYDCVVITNSKCSKEKCDSIRAYGANLMIAEPEQDYMQMETDLAEENPDWFSVNQYDNLDNPDAHYKTTGPEIYRQTCGTVTHFVMAGSTGGTISGVGGYLKDQNPAVKVSDPLRPRHFYQMNSLCVVGSPCRSCGLGLHKLLPHWRSW